MLPKIYPYKMGSHSARALAEALSAVRVREGAGLRRAGYKMRGNHLVINWGNPRTPAWFPHTRLDLAARFLNKPNFVSTAGNKLWSFERMLEAGVSIPEFTTDRFTALDWNQPFIARILLSGSGGRGCFFVDIENGISGPDLSRCRLFTKYIKKRGEYRVHVFNGQVIDVQEKKKRREADVDSKIRSYNNGWVFCREDVDPPEMVKDEAVKAVTALSLDFGAVDVVWNQRLEKAYVLEVNTAPGIEGTTLGIYSNKIRELCNEARL